MKKLMPIILILVSIGMFFLVIDPQYKKIQELNKEIAENNRMLKLAQELKEKRDDLQDKFNSFGEDDRKNLEKILPDTVDNVRLILDINNIANDVGIKITNIGINNEGEQGEQTDRNSNVIDRTSSSGYGTIALSFSVSSTYDVFKVFMKRLENSLRLVDIVDFSVLVGGSDFYGYNVTLNTYWLR